MLFRSRVKIEARPCSDRFILTLARFFRQGVGGQLCWLPTGFGDGLADSEVKVSLGENDNVADRCSGGASDGWC